MPIRARCSPPIRAMTGPIAGLSRHRPRLSRRFAPRSPPSTPALWSGGMADDLLTARGLVVAYGRPAGLFDRRGGTTTVLHGVDIRVGKGETVGIVGESGSGKTTLGRALLGLVKPKV